MFSAATLRLGPSDLAQGRPYPERHEEEAGWLDRLAVDTWHGAVLPLARIAGARRRRAHALVARVDAFAAEIAALDDDELRAEAHALRPVLRSAGFEFMPVARAFALVREAATRVLQLRHYDTQLIAGWWLLQGSLVEMATGEGKTIAATLPTVTAALGGLPVHVITVNDYLASRDAATLAPLYEFFGLSVRAVVNGLDRHARRAAYGCDITYISNKELAFDYLRDRAALGDRASRLHLALDALRDDDVRGDRTVMRGLAFGIVDEADSVFIDEARTPLILSASRGGTSGSTPFEAALSFASSLEVGKDFELDRGFRRVYLTAAGESAIESSMPQGEEGSLFASSREAREAVERALAALHLYSRDQHYVVVEGKVQIVDESTGRVMPDRAWERGLHQMIEAKEGVALTAARETLARITYQRLFRRYLRLAGMSGTATEVALEIGRTYGLPVVRVPLHRPSRRTIGHPRCCANREAKWQAVVQAIERVAVGERRPVLVGTRTVKASEELAALLAARGIEHVVLNAKQDREEAAIVARAGEAGRVTVATNMAGRGTDIRLAEGVADRGGLHVILTEYHESRRVDRQLFGRSARQGEAGSGEAIVAIDDDLFVTELPGLVRWLTSRAKGPNGIGPLWLALLRRLGQAKAEGRSRDTRVHSVQQDRRYAQLLAFAGRGE